MSHETTTWHPYHLVNPSPWPIVTAFSLLFVASGIVMMLHGLKIFGLMVLGFGALVFIGALFSWWADVLQEGIVDKAHNEITRQSVRIALVMFIASEVFFFLSFFWAIYRGMLDPSHIVADLWTTANIFDWPPKTLKVPGAGDIPLTNTLILLLSGTCVEWAHHGIEKHNRTTIMLGLFSATALGCLFTFLQAAEYVHAEFAIGDGAFAGVFYVATGFHGAHVIIGTIFLGVCAIRAALGHFDKGKGRVGFEFAAAYWHFVDVVWLLLYVSLYVL